MEYKIFTGTMLSIKKGFMKGSWKMMYCGMPNDDAFVLAPLLYHGYQGFSPSIYYNARAVVIQVDQKVFDVIEVTPEYIVLAD